MELLERRILSEGKVLDGGVLKVGSFLNQRIDTSLLGQMADEAAKLFEGEAVDKILTVEASGIAFAVAVALKFKADVVVAKKHRSSNVSGDCFEAEAASFTHGGTNKIIVEKDYLSKGDRILICDDFLAEGNAMQALLDIAAEAQARVVGCLAEIEKGFQGGGDRLRDKGVNVKSLAIVEDMSDGKIVFRQNNRM